MGSRAYLAAKSQREVYEGEIAREKAEVEGNPEEKREELELFYRRSGRPVSASWRISGLGSRRAS